MRSVTILQNSLDNFGSCRTCSLPTFFEAILADLTANILSVVVQFQFYAFFRNPECCSTQELCCQFYPLCLRPRLFLTLTIARGVSLCYIPGDIFHSVTGINFLFTYTGVIVNITIGWSFTRRHHSEILHRRVLRHRYRTTVSFASFTILNSEVKLFSGAKLSQRGLVCPWSQRWDSKVRPSSQ